MCSVFLWMLYLCVMSELIQIDTLFTCYFTCSLLVNKQFPCEQFTRPAFYNFYYVEKLSYCAKHFYGELYKIS